MYLLFYHILAITISVSIEVGMSYPGQTQALKHTLDGALIPEFFDAQHSRGSDVHDQASAKLQQQLNERHHRSTKAQGLIRIGGDKDVIEEEAQDEQRKAHGPGSQQHL